MKKKQTILITFLSITAFILAILVSERFWMRLDLTKNKAYTISKVSRDLYREIPEPVTISYYISDRLKSIHPVAGEIEDTLREYTSYSRGKIRLIVKDPVKSGEAAMIEEMGLQPMQVRNIEQDQASLTTVYSGIIIEYLDKIEIIPFLFDTGTLEYDLTSRIRAMVTNTERIIGVITGDNFRQWDEDFRYLAMTFENAGYKVRIIFPGDEIPEVLPALFVLGGAEDLDETALYRIDRYIQTGGKVLFAVKGVFVDTVYGSIAARHQESRGLLEMISFYGASIHPELVLDRNALLFQYQTRTSTGMIQRRIIRYPLWIGVSGENGNQEHPVSANFGGIDLYWASPISLNPPSGVNAQILFTSTDEAWLQTETFHTNPDILYMLEIEADTTKGRKILGASLHGIFPRFFSDFQKPHEDLPDMPNETKPSRIIVVGDVDFATNISYQSEGDYNMNFLMRAADWLVNDDDIIGIRSRQPQAGRLDKIQDTASKRFAMKFSEILNVWIIPAFTVFAGLIISYKRRKGIMKNIPQERTDDGKK